ncbi:MAG: biopolymer transporter ExbD [Planctomycetota bacterium]
MASKKAKEVAREEIPMNMTPMIDCTFLLLIFFMCSIKFKVLEGKIPAYLPKDVGVNATPIDKELEKIDIEIHRLVPAPTWEQVRELWAQSRQLWTWDEKEIKILVNNEKCASLRDFYEKISALHQRLPDLKATLYPMNQGPNIVIYADTVKVVNECLRAGLLDITFGGTLMDS